jgi:hypothetical protein
MELNLLSVVEFITQIQNPKQPFHAPHAHSATLPLRRLVTTNTCASFSIAVVSPILPTAIVRHITRINTTTNHTTANDGLHHYHNEVEQISSNNININKNSTSPTGNYEAAQHSTLSRSSVETSAPTGIAIAITITPTMPATTRTKARTIM